MSLPIVHYNDPVLRRKGDKISVFDLALRRLAEEMVESMHEAEGIGLAAQQVGRALQLCVVDLRRSDADFSWELDGARPPRELFMPLVIVNPEVVPQRGTPDSIVEEGCLSFPKIRGDVRRPEAIVARFRDERGDPHVLACNGLLARCIQHEADHLNGVLFIDRMDPRERAALDADLKALARRTRAGGGPKAAKREPRATLGDPNL